jgi:hypothetical protein
MRSHGAGIRHLNAVSLTRLGSGDAARGRASKLQHTIQHMDGDVHLGRLAYVRARVQAVADHLLEPADGHFVSGQLRVSGSFLPGARPRSAMN